MNLALNRTGVLYLTNKSGGLLTQGAVGIVDSANAASFTTITTAAYTGGLIVVVLDTAGIANNARGAVAITGYVPKINLSSAASLGHRLATHTVAGQAAPHAAPSVAGDFGMVLGIGTTPAAVINTVPMLDSGRVLISETSPSGVGTVTFNTIAGTYKKLTIEFVARGSQAASFSSMLMHFNNDSTVGNYASSAGYAYSATVGAGATVADEICTIAAASCAASEFTHGNIEVLQYANTGFFKHARGSLGLNRNDVGEIVFFTSLDWKATTAITRIDLVLASGNFAANSVFRLYGEH